jgi:hypothetical protein
MLSACAFKQRSARKGVTICVQAVRTDSNNQVTDAYVRLRQHRLSVDNANNTTNDVYLTLHIYARHFCGLAPQEGDAILTACFSSALDYSSQNLGLQSPRSKVVQEEERLRTLH